MSDNTKDTPMDKTPEHYIDQHLILKNTVDDEQGDIVFIMRKYADQQTESLKLELQKQKELNAELVKVVKNWLALKVHYVNDVPVISANNKEERAIISSLESLIKKSSEI